MVWVAFRGRGILARFGVGHAIGCAFFLGGGVGGGRCGQIGTGEEQEQARETAL